MKKLFTIVTLLATLLATNIADAKFSDEYKAKYPRRVKTTTTQLPSGRFSTSTDYFLFKANPTGLSLRVSEIDGIKVCFINYVYKGRYWNFYYKISWGDGNASYDNTTLMKYRDTFRGGVIEIITTAVNPEELKNAIVFHAHSENYAPEVILNESHKRWKEWQEAVEAAA